VAVLTLGLAGCGSTKYVTTTTTSTATLALTSTSTETDVSTKYRAQAPASTIVSTTTVTAPAAGAPSSGAAGYASQYPSAFEDSFSSACISDGGDEGSCGCALRYIEQHEPYQTVVAAEHKIAIGEPPSWYTAAENQCAGQ
jgi:hypothetical protein